EERIGKPLHLRLVRRGVVARFDVAAHRCVADACAYEEHAAEGKDATVGVVLLIRELRFAVERDTDGGNESYVDACTHVARDLDHPAEAHDAGEPDTDDRSDPERPEDTVPVVIVLLRLFVARFS